ncbi:sugar phosphate isomerase/epimerase family protein [Lacticaseibacillus sp. GG6-2]
MVAKIKRGVTAYSYNKEFGLTMNLDDIMRDISDTGATGIEILANSHIPGYPYVDDAWVEKWRAGLRKYNLEPAEYAQWVDSRLYEGRELGTQESIDILERDFKIAHKLGFKFIRTKLGVIDDTLTPVKNWQDFIKGAFDLAEKYDVYMCPEIHAPSLMDSKMVWDYCDFIEKTGTKRFGLNVDFSLFQARSNSLVGYDDGFPHPDQEHSPVSDFEQYIKYTLVCHAKFMRMDENFREMVIPYNEIFALLKKHNWSGWMISEYEGAKADVPGHTSEQIKRHQIMLKNMLGE